MSRNVEIAILKLVKPKNFASSFWPKIIHTKIRCSRNALVTQDCCSLPEFDEFQTHLFLHNFSWATSRRTCDFHFKKCCQKTCVFTTAFCKVIFWFRDQVFALDFYLCKLMILLKKSLNILTGKLKLWKLPKNSGNVQKILSQHLKNLLVSLLLTNSACVYTPTYGLARISGFLKSGQHSKQCVVVFIVS